MAALEIPIDEVVYFDVITSSSTGSATDADSTPTFSVYEESTDTAILGPTNFTKRTALTGNYRGTFTASVANGFEAGKWYSVIGSATVSSVAGKCVCMNFRCKPAESSAGVPKVDLELIKAQTVTCAAGVTVPAALASTTNITSATGVKLASDGLDTIATTAPTGTASNFREMLVQVWRRFFKKATRTTTQLRTYADDGVTVVTSQAISSDGTTESQGSA